MSFQVSTLKEHAGPRRTSKITCSNTSPAWSAPTSSLSGSRALGNGTVRRWQAGRLPYPVWFARALDRDTPFDVPEKPVVKPPKATPKPPPGESRKQEIG